MDLRTRRRAAWAAPVVVAALVGGTALVASSSASADAHPDLPPLDAAQLLVAVQGSGTTALSGTVVETARLGLPELPGPGSAALDVTSLLTGSHTAKVWVDGPDRQRLALVAPLEESDVVRDGREVWTWSSRTQQATRTTLPERPAEQPQPPVGAVTPAVTPADAAARALAALDPSTVVTVENTSVVADRPAYTLALAPRDTRSTVRRVEVAVDSQTKVPLRVRVYGAGAQPALETGFTDVTFARPAASVFTFRAPEGATVTERDLGAYAGGAAPEAPDAPAGPDAPRARTVGTGWTTVLVLPAGSAPTSDPTGLLDRLATPQPGGDRLVRTALVNALLLADGRVLVGAVQPDVLREAAGS